MFKVNFFAGIVISFLAIAGCQSPNVATPTASATPVASSSPAPSAPSASPTAALTSEAATYLSKVENAAKTVISKAVGNAREEGPRFVDSSISTEGAYIELDGKLLIVLPAKATIAKKNRCNIRHKSFRQSESNG